MWGWWAGRHWLMVELVRIGEGSRNSVSSSWCRMACTFASGIGLVSIVSGTMQWRWWCVQDVRSGRGCGHALTPKNDLKPPTQIFYPTMA